MGALDKILLMSVSVKICVFRLGSLIMFPQKFIGHIVKTTDCVSGGKLIELSHKFIVKLKFVSAVRIFVKVNVLDAVTKIRTCHSWHIFWIMWSWQSKSNVNL